MLSGVTQSIPVGQMARLKLPVRKYYGRPMCITGLQSDGSVHSDSRCPSVVLHGDTVKRRVLFDADIASRMCSCCCVESDDPCDEGLETAIVDLVFLRELLAEEDEEEQCRDDPGNVPNFLRANFNPDHWRTIQRELTQTADSLQHQPWLYHWASPHLTRAASYAERRCEERRRLIDSAAIERTAAVLYERGKSEPELARMWSSWRRREVSSLPSPDDEFYGESRLCLPGPGSTSTAASVTISLRLPPGTFEAAGLCMLETLSNWEQDAIAAYETAAHWVSGTVTLTAPPVVARELLCPARNLDLMPSVQAASRQPIEPHS
ncbi:hypothetical protein ACFYT4_32835 [Streptomyces sp. NPDC004609]|uniref:hypothetical protein n=1 Tax=Streptomyces sp. NPDC004609 TaxID=3364704 RepID=UPI0036A92B48